MIVWLATLKADVVNVACPEPFKATLAAKVVAPSVKLTVPVGVPAPGAVAATVAVNVTTCPNTEALGDELTVVVLLSLFTTCGEAESVPEPLWKLPSPPYAAVIVWLPTASDEIVNVACPEDMATLAARVAVPSLKVTVPVAVPDPGATALTVAVKVTTCPNTDALGDELTAVLLASLFTTCGAAESLPLLLAKLLSPL